MSVSGQLCTTPLSLIPGQWVFFGGPIAAVKGAQARLREQSERREKPESLRVYRRPFTARMAAHADRRGKVGRRFWGAQVCVADESGETLICDDQVLTLHAVLDGSSGCARKAPGADTSVKAGRLILVDRLTLPRWNPESPAAPCFQAATVSDDSSPIRRAPG